MASSKDHTMKIKEFLASKNIDHWEIEDVPGIGEAIGSRLRRVGVNKAGHLYDEYQARGKKTFMAYIERYGGNIVHQKDAYHTMHEWDRRHG